MVDEGVAREVINRIQKLRKKVSFMDERHENTTGFTLRTRKIIWGNKIKPFIRTIRILFMYSVSNKHFIASILWCIFDRNNISNKAIKHLRQLNCIHLESIETWLFWTRMKFSRLWSWHDILYYEGYYEELLVFVTFGRMQQYIKKKKLKCVAEMSWAIIKQTGTDTHNTRFRCKNKMNPGFTTVTVEYLWLFG